MNIKHYHEGTEDEYAVVEIGDWSFFISEEDGEPQVNVPDHLNLRIDGDPKDQPTIWAEACEFPTDLMITNFPGEPGEPNKQVYRHRLQEGFDYFSATNNRAGTR